MFCFHINKTIKTNGRVVTWGYPGFGGNSSVSEFLQNGVIHIEVGGIEVVGTK